MNADVITAHLGIQPSRLREDKFQRFSKETGASEISSHKWVLDSPKSDGDPTARLSALADVIEPFSEKLLTLDVEFQRFIDIVYHVTPQRSNSVFGEFDWFRMPSELMRRLGAWNLDVSYEAFWFDHPDYVKPS